MGVYIGLSSSDLHAFNIRKQAGLLLHWQVLFLRETQAKVPSVDPIP